jgi:tetratricopeptide (TPR) repeat protein
MHQPSNMHLFENEIKSHIAQGDTEAAIKLLMDFVCDAPDDYQRQALLISSTFYSLRRAYIAEPVPQIELYRVNQSILDVLHDRKRESDALTKAFGPAAVAVAASPFQAYLTLANGHLSDLQLDLALQSYEQVLTKDPQNVEAQKGAEICHFLIVPESEYGTWTTELYLAKIEILEQLHPENKSLNLLKVSVLWGNGDKEEAIEICREILATHPDFYQAHIAIGYYLQDLGDLEAAGQHYEASLKINKRSAIAHNNVGYVYRLKNEMAKAIDHYQKSLKLSYTMLTLLNLTDCYRFQADFAHANHYALLAKDFIDQGHSGAPYFWGGDWMYNFHPITSNQVTAQSTILFITNEDKQSLLYFNLAVQHACINDAATSELYANQAITLDLNRQYGLYYRNQIQSLVETLGSSEADVFWPLLVQLYDKV